MRLKKLTIATIVASALFALSCRSSQQIHETLKIVEVHDTVRVSALNDRHDSIVYVYRNDTVMIDRWHNVTKVDTVYRNNTEYVHDTVRMENIETRQRTEPWTIKDKVKTELKAFLIGVLLTALIALGVKIGSKINYNR